MAAVAIIPDSATAPEPGRRDCRLGLGTPLNESFEDWGIAPDLSLGRHLCADDFPPLHGAL